jgi:hypothetical protein
MTVVVSDGLKIEKINGLKLKVKRDHNAASDFSPGIYD